MTALTSLPSLPLEQILSYLSSSDRKHLRLASKAAATAVQLQIRRVFLSANPLNIEVFRHIADHDFYRHKVREIVWDVALLEDVTSKKRNNHKRFVDLSAGEFTLSPDYRGDPFSGWDAAPGDDEIPLVFRRGCAEEMKLARRRAPPEKIERQKIRREAEARQEISLAECWEYYCVLHKQQTEVLRSNLDMRALEYGLERFESLQRLTITPVAHGFLFMPLYTTPMIRAFPFAFRYKIPRAWPMTRGIKEAPLWESAVADGTFRGFREALALLATGKAQSVTELVIDTQLLHTGVSCHLFDKPNSDYDNLVQILRRPSFRRLDLSLTAGQDTDWTTFENGRLRDALACATNLEHLHLHTDISYCPARPVLDLDTIGAMEYYVALSNLLPIESWPRLRHLAVSNFSTTHGDLLKLLRSLPDTIRSVELWSIRSTPVHGVRYDELMQNLRLLWRDRPQEKRITLSIIHQVGFVPSGIRTLIRDEISEFLYGDGENPFVYAADVSMDKEVADGVGKTIDAFLPAPWNITP